VVAIALLVGSVGATAVWAHDSRGPFASARPGIERLGGPQSGGARVSPGMPGKMFNRQPGAGQVLPHRQAKPSPSPTATTGY
jgi:hypothetical protein